VILVDDGSSDDTAEIIEEFVLKHENWRLLRFVKGDGQQGVIPALVHGISNSRHEIILRTDADCVVNQDWIQAMLAKFDSRTSMMIGFCNLEVGKGALQGFLLFDNLVSGLFNGSFARIGFPIGCSGGNMAFRKTSFQEAGGFSSILKYETGEDTHLAQLFLKRRVGKIRHCLCPNSFVWTPSPRTLGGIVSRMMRINSETCKMNAVQVSVRLCLLASYFAPFVLVFHAAKPGLALLLLRYALEHLYLKTGASAINRAHPAIPNVIFQALYPVYLVGFGIAGGLGKWKWKWK
jgi:cellulose synthase/poly-beta-1,6-N-acetylglucosamine synthase-like glycosyltransferase